MSITQISKIQHRTGALVDLPQLSTGELGYATDVQRLFIGNDPATTNTEVITQPALDAALITVNCLVINLPTPPVIGMRRIVTDANSTAFASIVTGGGANIVPVYYDGSNWRIG